MSFYASKSTNRNAKRILLKDIEPEQEGPAQRLLSETEAAIESTSAYLAFAESSDAVRAVLQEPERSELLRLLRTLLAELAERAWTQYCRWTEVRLRNSAISLFRTEVERKTGSPAEANDHRIS